ncbi:protein bangles and beads [Drosophila grimshawi]|uniref:protein bangles and beads n=1 Tax=Drosophila grimshawi TaxID=7222 RepID=UPI000C86FBC2|nr:protein bangles and beads [Drosophila grimshawi]
MAIAESHLFGSCKAVPGRCYNRNKPHAPLTHAPLLYMMLAAMLTSCLALTSESTTPSLLDLAEATTLIPPQQPANEANLLTAIAVVNETNIEIKAEKTIAAEVVDEFEPLVGLEQGIRNAVKSEVESEIEADSVRLETLQVEQQETEEKPANTNDEQKDAAKGVREPKTLEANDESQPEEPVNAEVTENAAENEKAEETEKAEDSEKAEETEKTEESEQPEETETAEKVKEPVEIQQSEEPSVAEKSTDAVTNNESEPSTANESSAVASEQVVEIESRPLPTVTSDLVAVIFDENRAITEQPITKTNLLALEQEHEQFQEAETTPQPTHEVSRHQVTKKQGVEDLLPIYVQKEYTAEPTSVQVHLNEIDENVIESEQNESEIQAATSSTTQPDHVESTEAAVSAVQPAEEAVVEGSEPVLTAASETPEESLTPTEVYTEQSEETEVEAEPVEPIAPAVEAITPKSSSSASPVEPAADKSDESIEDDSKEESDVANGNSENQTEQSAVEQAEKDSSEESDELSADEPKARAEDSTATPLVSYPPHNSGQTFDSNLADERSAHLSLASTNRSTLIVALCSGTAVIFIVISLVIFVLSFQRQRGTLDIEMQEQRLGKDDLDQEDAQMKLLDVELTAPVIIAMGNEETDECL